MFTSDKAFSIIAFVALTGATGIASSNCPQGQHNCCTADHAVQMAHTCVDSHLKAIIEPAPAA